jgi:hypothetical protein
MAACSSAVVRSSQTLMLFSGRAAVMKPSKGLNRSWVSYGSSATTLMGVGRPCEISAATGVSPISSPFTNTVAPLGSLLKFTTTLRTTRSVADSTRSRTSSARAS